MRGDGVRHSGSGVLRRDRASVPPLAAVEHFGEGEVCVIGHVCLSDTLCDVVSSFVSLLSIDIPINTMHRAYQHHTSNLSTPHIEPINTTHRTYQHHNSACPLKERNSPSSRRLRLTRSPPQLCTRTIRFDSAHMNSFAVLRLPTH